MDERAKRLPRRRSRTRRSRAPALVDGPGRPRSSAAVTATMRQDAAGAPASAAAACLDLLELADPGDRRSAPPGGSARRRRHGGDPRVRRGLDAIQDAGRVEDDVRAADRDQARSRPRRRRRSRHERRSRRRPGPAARRGSPRASMIVVAEGRPQGLLVGVGRHPDAHREEASGEVERVRSEPRSIRSMIASADAVATSRSTRGRVERAPDRGRERAWSSSTVRSAQNEVFADHHHRDQQHQEDGGEARPEHASV